MFKKLFVSYSTKAERKLVKKDLAFGLITGILLGISFPPIPLPYFLFCALIPYLIVIERRDTLASINRFTYFAFFFFNLITLYWVGSWTKDADPFLMIAGTVLMFFNPIVFLIPSSLYYLSKKYISKSLALFFLPWFWLFYEYIYSVSDFKFPWISLGNGLSYFNSYIQIADIIGVYGLTLLIIYANVFAYLAFKYFRNRKSFSKIFFTMFLAVIIIPIIYGQFKKETYIEENAKIKVGLIQPNLNPNKKWEAGNLDEQISLYLNMSKEALKNNSEIIICPETALPVYLMSDRYRDEYLRIQDFVDSTGTPILTGMPHANYYFDSLSAPADAKSIKNSKYYYTSYNSILFLTPQNEVRQYGKIKLVPFGEKVPLVETFPILGKWIRWNVGISSWNTGIDTIVFNYNHLNMKYNIGGVICIESIYPDFVAAFVKRGADFIAVVTNDSWYGNSSGPYQHKEISVLRAIENRRTVVRAANGGISCIIDPLGKTISSTEMFTKTVLTGEVELRKEKTFFTKYPLLFPYLSIFISLITIILFLYKKIIERKSL